MPEQVTRKLREAEGMLAEGTEISEVGKALRRIVRLKGPRGAAMRGALRDGARGPGHARRLATRPQRAARPSALGTRAPVRFAASWRRSDQQIKRLSWRRTMRKSGHLTTSGHSQPAKCKRGVGAGGNVVAPDSG